MHEILFFEHMRGQAGSAYKELSSVEHFKKFIDNEEASVVGTCFVLGSVLFCLSD